MTTDLERRLVEVFADILGIDPATVTPDLNPDDCEQWDSLSHLKLVAAIEQEFEVELSPEEQVDMLSFDLVVATVSKKLDSA